jgi:cell division protein FtsQ
LLAEVNPGDAPLLSEVAIVATALPQKLRGKVDRITAASRDSITLVLKSGRMVTWGNSSDSELKAQVVSKLLKRKPKSSIDVSSPHNPAIS